MALFNFLKFNTNFKNSNYKYYSDNTREWYITRDKYQSLWNEHFNNLKLISELYSKAIEEENIYNNFTQQVIEICLKDISIAQDLMNCCIKQAKINNQNIEENVPVYSSFITLAEIYEKQGKYQEAIDICNKSINMGYTRNEPKGHLQERIDKLNKKIR